MAAHTNRNVATSGYKKGTVSKSSRGGTPGTLFPYRTCSRGGHRYKTSGRPCGATNRRVDIVCEGRTGRGFSLDQARDPKPRTIWRGHPRGHTCHNYDLVRMQSMLLSVGADPAGAQSSSASGRLEGIPQRTLYEPLPSPRGLHFRWCPRCFQCQSEHEKDKLRTRPGILNHGALSCLKTGTDRGLTRTTVQRDHNTTT